MAGPERGVTSGPPQVPRRERGAWEGLPFWAVASASHQGLVTVRPSAHLHVPRSVLVTCGVTERPVPRGRNLYTF